MLYIMRSDPCKNHNPSRLASVDKAVPFSGSILAIRTLFDEAT